MRLTNGRIAAAAAIALCLVVSSVIGTQAAGAQAGGNQQVSVSQCLHALQTAKNAKALTPEAEAFVMQCAMPARVKQGVTTTNLTVANPNAANSGSGFMAPEVVKSKSIDAWVTYVDNFGFSMLTWHMKKTWSYDGVRVTSAPNATANATITQLGSLGGWAYHGTVTGSDVDRLEPWNGHSDGRTVSEREGEVANCPPRFFCLYFYPRGSERGYYWGAAAWDLHA